MDNLQDISMSLDETSAESNMEQDATELRKAQLDKQEREHLEDVVTEMRERVEANVRYQLEEHDLKEMLHEDASLSDAEEDLVQAIELEAVDGNDWEEGYEQYITGVGYTIVNRLAALRCMEVRDFIDDEVTRFREDGLTPAADRLVTEDFMLEEEAVLEAYRNACDDLDEEIEILFDRSTAYSLIDPDDDTFEDLCGMLDEVPDEVWRADDVLGWVYEYYNTPRLEEVQRKAREDRLDIEDVPAANQFYTPHWVVRSLTDNSLGKLYLESTQNLDATLDAQSSLSVSERIDRGNSPDQAPEMADLCTYLVSEGKKNTESTFQHPSEIQVIDPACGSGHFLLYAFDILERIWWNECPDIPREEIPVKILENNLYGIDIDLRACQLSAFSLYLKARTRAESEGEDRFNLPKIGIVCADARIADSSDAAAVFEEVAGDTPDLKDTLENLLRQFEDIQGLGSLLKVRDTISDEFLDRQAKITESWGSTRSLNAFIDELHETISERQNGDSFLAQDLKSFLRLLQILSQDYDVALMNPPYGAKKRMPEEVTDYVKEHYEYGPEYYINLFEVCESVLKDGGRIGMIVPRTFMFKSSFQDFREDFIGPEGSFDFLAEYGNEVLDNATVRTVGTTVRVGERSDNDLSGTFLRLHDVDTYQKEQKFVEAAFGKRDDDIPRKYVRPISEFELIPGSPLSYWAPPELRSLYDSKTVFDAENGNLDDRESLGTVKQGLITGDNDRFVRRFWEVVGYDYWVPFAKGGEDAWIFPQVNLTVAWGERGEELRRYEGSRVQNTQYFFKEALTYTYMKASGRRFGYLHEDSIFGRAGCAFIPNRDAWDVLSYSNSSLITYLMICQTPDRQWEVGYVSKLPWREDIIRQSDLDEQAREIAGILLAVRGSDITSPHYSGPALLEHVESVNPEPLYEHPHRTVLDNLLLPAVEQNLGTDASISQLSVAADRRSEKLRSDLQQKSMYIDQYVFDLFGLDEENRERVYREIDLRTNEDPRRQQEYNPEEVTESRENTIEYVKDLLTYLSIKIVQEDSDGIVVLPNEIPSARETLLDEIVAEFQSIFGSNSEDRLAEVDALLGGESGTEKAYPNMRNWLRQDFFEYHLSEFDNRPILWKITTENLVPDPTGDGFSCLISYRKLDSDIFDRLSNQYLEARRAEFRKRRSAANQRRNDESLSTSERADATEEFEFCSSALEQIAALEEVMQELGSMSEREFDEDDRKLVEELAPKVAAFRKETAERIEMLAELRERNGEEWFQEIFSDKFWDTVEKWRDEWLDALDELEHACEEYAKLSDEPVEAHLADLFDYFNSRLKGSDHYSSTGILFMIYYFEREGADLLNEDGEPFENLTKDERLLASLATGIDDASIIDEEYLEQIAGDEDVDDIDELPPLAEFKALAEEIDDRCQAVDKQIPSDWSDRALSEITTAGYQPNQKHGVAINITPLAAKDIVPEVVEDKVL